MPDPTDQLIPLAQLLLAALLGAVVGAQREIHGAPAGMRTHLMVSFGSALFTIISASAFGGFETSPGTSGLAAYDPTRIAAQIVTGIGFLGAGAIIKDGTTIRGLTTAASLWAVAAIGMAVGAGSVVLAVGATAIILFSLGPLGHLSHRLAQRAARQLRVRLRVSSVEVIHSATAALLREGLEIHGVSSEPLAQGSFEVEIEVGATARSTPSRVLAVVLAVAGVEAAEAVSRTD